MRIAITVRIDPTSRGDMQAALLRSWYELNRETAWRRMWRRTDVADEFILGLMAEARRLDNLMDAALLNEIEGKD